MQLFRIKKEDNKIKVILFNKTVLSHKLKQTQCEQQTENKDYTPVNFRKLDNTHIEEDAKYTSFIVKSYLEVFDKFNLDPNGLNIVEIGPGIDFGAQLILASMGANVTLCDRFLTPFDPDYHPQLYKEIARIYDWPNEQLLKAQQGYENTTLKLLCEPAEDLKSIPNSSVDLIFSNAVLEHVADMLKVAKEFARITKTGGIGSHQIDMRDHRDFTHPLEHLAMDEEEYQKIAVPLAYEFGNRLRQSQFQTFFENAGFEVVDFMCNMTASPEYLAEILPKIKASNSIYNNYFNDDLKCVSGKFFVKKIN